MIFIIAEAGINWQGKTHVAMRMCDIAKESGADCVKFQLFPPLDGLPDWSWEHHRKISEHCKDIGIEYAASCFSMKAVDFALTLGVRFIKIASGEITNWKLIGHVAESGKPMVLSTGMSVMDDIFRATIRFAQAGGTQYSLLHCVSNYPTLPEHCNVKGITTLAYNFMTRGVAHKPQAIGFSDHSLYDAPSIMAVGLGAKIIEKHFTLDNTMEGPDHAFSLEPKELKHFCRGIRVAEACLGNGDRNTLQPGEAEMQKKARGRW